MVAGREQVLAWVFRNSPTTSLAEEFQKDQSMLVSIEDKVDEGRDNPEEQLAGFLSGHSSSLDATRENFTISNLVDRVREAFGQIQCREGADGWIGDGQWSQFSTIRAAARDQPTCGNTEYVPQARTSHIRVTEIYMTLEPISEYILLNNTAANIKKGADFPDTRTRI
ncbi:hypothetical protein H4Q26_015872 [Puccinia striiformis f. sp. tritici PST-130]|nr:hypothetical protein H4Q26_015872 [Puccinia striiformis f. sp. tritici PST-130]